MDKRLNGINIMRARLDKKLQSYWSEMFALKYESSWEAARQANTIFEHGHKLIAFCQQINLMKHSAANHLHKAWDNAYKQHTKMRHCRDAKVVHPSIPDTNTEGVLRYFLQEAENKCNSLLLSVRMLDTESQVDYTNLLRELESTIDCIFDLELISRQQRDDAYQVLDQYYHKNYTTQIVNFTH